MKQVNTRLPDDVYEYLLELAAKRQLADKKLIRLSHVASDLLIDKVNELRTGSPSNLPTLTPSEDIPQDSKPKGDEQQGDGFFDDVNMDDFMKPL